MYPKYFKDKIFEELNASYEYLKKALDSMKSYPEWAEKFKSMSDDRYKNALTLYAMFMKFYKDSRNQDTYINSIRDNIIENFTAQMQKIESYRITYDLMMNPSDSKEEVIINERSITDE